MPKLIDKDENELLNLKMSTDEHWTGKYWIDGKKIYEGNDLRVGLFILGLWVFRICWGLWGSDTARFSQFVQGPAQIKRYLAGQISENEQPGHNPMGALMVVGLLAAIGLQLLTGLFAADENTFTHSGYLNGWVSDDTGSLMRTIWLWPPWRCP